MPAPKGISVVSRIRAENQLAKATATAMISGGKHGRQPQRLKAGDQSLVRLHIIDRHAQIFADQAPA
jgi:hypothetical protein